MNLGQVKREVEALGKSRVAEKVYPITSDWVPLPDVLAIINRFEKHWKSYKETKKGATEAKLIAEILGES
ncbi:MAG: hypothetical protein ABSE39_08950 [Candidatus Bathyarchaeia archaeon]|jgi:hypothetical protein